MAKKKVEPKEEKLYQITCNEEQIRIMANALEQHSRIICGQLGESFMPGLEHGMMKEQYYNKKKELEDKAMTNYCNVREDVQTHLNIIKKMVWDMEVNASHGIGYDEEADLTYEMYKQILYTFQMERKEECDKKGEEYSSNVHSYPCLKLTDSPLMEIKVLKNEK